MNEENGPSITEIKTRDIDSVLEQGNLKKFKNTEQSIINHERFKHLQAIRKAVDALE